MRPYFFTENIADNSSPHEKLDPLTSAQIIVSHVTDGVDLAQKYRLPPRIQDFIREHHGRSVIQYFYTQAQREATANAPVDPENYRYPGPNPRTKETAILLLADTCEAAVRAMRPGTREELEKFINKLIDGRVAEGVLNQCELTFKDLQTIREVFIQVLQGVHHPRVTYPEPIQPPSETSAKLTATPAAAAPVTNAVAATAATSVETKLLPNGNNGHARREAANNMYRENGRDLLGGIEEMEIVSH